MALIDKGYYDYDYKEVEAKAKIITIEESQKNEGEMLSALKRFGWGKQKPQEESKPEGAEELREAVLKDLETRRDNSGSEVSKQ